MEIKIRKFSDSDYNKIVCLVDDFQNYIVSIDQKKIVKPFDSKEDCKKYLDQLIDDTAKKKGAFYIAESQGEIVGFIQGIIDDNEDTLYSLSHKSGAHGWIGEVYVDSSYRGQGIARLLIDKIILYFKEMNCSGVRLSIMANNENAHNVYSKIGFYERGIEMAIDF